MLMIVLLLFQIDSTTDCYDRALKNRL